MDGFGHYLLCWEVYGLGYGLGIISKDNDIHLRLRYSTHGSGVGHVGIGMSSSRR